MIILPVPLTGRNSDRYVREPDRVDSPDLQHTGTELIDMGKERLTELEKQFANMTEEQAKGVARAISDMMNRPSEKEVKKDYVKKAAGRNAQ